MTSSTNGPTSLDAQRTVSTKSADPYTNPKTISFNSQYRPVVAEKHQLSIIPESNNDLRESAFLDEDNIDNPDEIS